MINNIVFVAAGSIYNNQCLFAILTLINVYDKKLPQDLLLVIYTDHGDDYEFLKEIIAIKIISINEQKVKEWLGDKNFMLKIKLQVVFDFLSNNKGNMLFADTDVIFKKRPDSIFKNLSKGSFYMHVFEFKASTKAAGLKGTEDESYFNKKITLNSGKIIEISRSTEMWNSGVIGLPQNTAWLIKDALELCDKLLSIKQYHTTEQLSFSAILSKEKELKKASPFIFHYWPKDYKVQMNEFINELFGSSQQLDINRLLLTAKKQHILRTTLWSKIIHNFHPHNIGELLYKKLPRILNNG